MSEQQNEAFAIGYRRAMLNGVYGTFEHGEEAVMSESDLYRAGYKEALTDVCKMFDHMHDRYTTLFNMDGDNMSELEKLEASLVTLNSVIYHLNTRLMGRKDNGKDE